MKKNTVNFLCNYASIYGGNFIPSILILAKEVMTEQNVIFTFPVAAKQRNWINEFYKVGILVFFIHFDSKEFKKELRKINKTNSVNLVYSHFNSGLRIKMVYPFAKKVKLFIHVHSDFYGGKKIPLKSQIKSWIEHNIIRRDASYIYVSSALWNRFAKHKNHFFLRNALCLNRIVALESKYTDICGLSKQDTVFLFFGWAPFVKGLDIVVKAFVDSNPPDTSKLIIVNKRDGGYDECMSFLYKMLKDPKYLNCDNIKYINPVEDSFDLYNIADIFVSASRSEGFSYSILESLYFNLRVISSDIEGVQWAKKYNNVFFFDCEKTDELSKLFEKNINYKKGNVCINQKIVKEFSISEWCNSIKKILNSN